MVCYNRKPRLRLAFFLRFSSASNAASSGVLDVGVGMNNPNPAECDSSKSDARWKSHATLTLLAKQDCPLWLQYD